MSSETVTDTTLPALDRVETLSIPDSVVATGTPVKLDNRTLQNDAAPLQLPNLTIFQLSNSATQYQYDSKYSNALPLNGIESSLLAPFIAEYNKLQNTLNQSNDSISRFTNKINTYKSQYNTVTYQLNLLSTQHNDDISTVTTLQQTNQRKIEEIEALKQRIATQQTECSTIRSDLHAAEAAAKKDTGDNESHKQIASINSEVNKYNDMVSVEQQKLLVIKNTNNTLSNEVESLLSTIDKNTLTEQQLDVQICTIKQSIRKSNTTKSDLEASMKHVQTDINNITTTHNSKLALKEQNEREIELLTNTINTLNQSIHDLQQDAATMEQKIVEQNHTLAAVQHNNAHMQQSNKHLVKHLNDQQRQLETLKHNYSKLQQDFTNCNAQLVDLQQQSQSLHNDKTTAEQTIEQYKQELIQLEHQVSQNNQHISTAVKEQQVLASQYTLKTDVIYQKSIVDKIVSNHIKTLLNEITSIKNNIQQLHKQIGSYKHDIHHYELYNKKKQLENIEYQQHITTREAEIADYRHQIDHTNQQCKSLTRQYDELNYTKNQLRKELLDSRSDMREHKLMYQYLTNALQQLKSEIYYKNYFITIETNNCHEVNTEITNLIVLNTNYNHKITLNKTQQSEQQQQIQHLNQVYIELTRRYDALYKQYKDQSKNYMQLNKRNNTSTTTINDVYEKIKLQQNLLHNYEQVYNTRLGENKQLNQQIADIQEQIDVARSDVDQLQKIQQQIVQYEKLIVHKNLENKYLSDEKSILLNIHRFDQLIDINPQLYQLIMNVNKIQKQLLKQVSQNDKMKDEIVKYEKLYTHLTKLLNYKYSEEIYTQIELYQKEIAQKSKQLQSVDIQLNIAINNTKQQEFTLHQVLNQLKLLKQAYIQDRFKQHKQRHSQINMTESTEWTPNNMDELDVTQLTGYNLDLTQLASYTGDDVEPNTLSTTLQRQSSPPIEYAKTTTLIQQHAEYSVG